MNAGRSRIRAGQTTPDLLPTGRMGVAACALVAMLLASCAAAQPRTQVFPLDRTYAWVATEAGNSQRSNAPADPSRYTIAFDADGRATLRLDCNRGSAHWTRDGERLALSPIASTKMMCGGDSLDAAFASDLAAVERWRLDGRDLVLTGRDGRSLRFRPLP